MRKVLLMLSIVFLCGTFYFVHGKTSERDGDLEQKNTNFEQVEKSQSKDEQSKQQSDPQNIDNKTIDFQKSFKILRSIVYSIFIFGLLVSIIVAMYFFLKKGKLREYIIKQVLGSKRIAEKFMPNDNIQPINVTRSYNLTEKDINTIVDRVLECKQLNEKEIPQQPKTIIKEGFELSKSVIKYLKGKSGKIFNRVENTPENSFFKLINESDDTAQFVFCGDEAEAIAKRIFSEDICDIVSGSYQNAHSVKTNKPGKIKLVGDQWEVTGPVEIKLI